MGTITIRHAHGFAAPAKGGHFRWFQFNMISTDHFKLPIHYNGSVFHDPDISGSCSICNYSLLFLIFLFWLICDCIRIQFLFAFSPLGSPFRLGEVLIIFPGNGLGWTFIHHFDDPSGGSPIHDHPGPSARVEDLNQFPETCGGMNTFGRNPEDCDLTVGVLSVSRI